MQNKKIAICIYRFLEKNFQSGGEKVNYYIIKALIELGFEVDLYCAFCDENITLKVNNVYREKAPDKKDYLFILGNNFIQNKTILYIHENSRHYQNKYTRNSFTNVIQQIFQPKRAKSIKERLSQEKVAAHNAKYLFVPSTVVKADIMEFFDVEEENIFLLPPPVEKITNNNYKKDDEMFTFGLSGRGFGNKGGWQLILASFLLKLQGYKFKVKIIYPFTTTLSSIKFIVMLMGLSKVISFSDYCSDMPKDFYSQINCLIMASKREAFGLVAPEAMQLNVPAIISSRCGVCDFIKDNENGFIYDYQKPLINLYKKMKYLLDNPSLCEKMKSNNISEITNFLSYEIFSNKLKEIMTKVGYLT